MTVENGTIILGISLIMIYLVLDKKHPIIAGIAYIAAGLSTYLVQPTDNPYGILIILLGITKMIMSKW